MEFPKLKLPYALKPGAKVDLDDIDPADTNGLEKEKDVKKRLEALREDLHELQGLLFADDSRSLLIVLQGMDASGKDGTIRHVLSGFSPLGVNVTAFKAPSDVEHDHDFLWRIHQVVPRRGEIGIFNRSHYEDVLVVRVRKLAPKDVWKARFNQINAFEKILAENGTVILKFFLHISKDEQKRRLQERLENPQKFWKFRLGDLEDRKLWDHFMEAYEDVLAKCSTPWAPWTVVPADHKWYRDLVVAESIVAALKGLDMKYPPPEFEAAKVKID